MSLILLLQLCSLSENKILSSVVVVKLSSGESSITNIELNVYSDKLYVGTYHFLVQFSLTS